MTRLIRTGFLLPLLILCSVALGQDAKLDSPRSTMFSFLEAINHVERGKGDLEAAWAQVLGTMHVEGLEADNARRAAEQLKTVLDKLGEIKEEDLPDAEIVRQEGVGRYQFFPRADKYDWVYEDLKPLARFPEGRIVLARSDDGRWRFDAATVAGIAALAHSLEPLPPRYSDPVAETEPEEVLGMLGATFQNTELWEWGALAACIFLGLAAGRITSYLLRKWGDRLIEKHWHVRGTIFHDFASPTSLALLTAGVYAGLIVFVQLSPRLDGFVHQVVELLLLIAVGWLLFNLIDVVEVALRKVTDKTDSKLDDMIVPLVRKTLRIFLIIVFALVAAENIFGMDVTGFLAGLGIAGLAISLAAQDSVKNLFGSLTIFFDKPFLVGDFITYDGVTGGVEEIGFRSTRIRLLSGHLVTVPNMKFIDSKVENISARPHIRREMNVTITYDTPPEKIEQAVTILREILTDATVIEQGEFDMENNPPQVSFSELNADSLNIKGYYWYKIPPDSDRGWFTYLEHAQIVNLMLFKRYAEAGIDFAFPTQTLYLAGDESRQLTVKIDRGEG